MTRNPPKAETSAVPSESAPPAWGVLRKVGDRVLYQPAEGGDEQPARVAWARPLTGLGGEITILAAEKKEELAWIPSLAALDAESRAVAAAELADGFLSARITRVLAASARYGNRYWEVETDRGAAHFMTGAPETAIFEPVPGRLVIRDVLGNCYEIPDLAALDPVSRKEVDKVV